MRDQSLPVDPARVFLFQDFGAPEASSCCEIFSENFPEGKIFTTDKNLGIALNFERAENFIFETLNSEVGLFFEDDLILTRYYMEAMHQLIPFAQEEDRVAYVAAYGNHRATLSDQIKQESDLMMMDHKWGFALTRRQWLRQKPILEPYLNIIRRNAYSKRDSKAIYDYFETLGYSSLGTSQDGAKDVASCVLGTIKIMTFVCLAKNAGRLGVHARPDFYDEHGFGNTELFTHAPKLRFPSTEQLDAWIDIQRKHGKQAIIEARANAAKASEEKIRLLATKATREEVITAYRLFLGREPESQYVVDMRVGKSIGDLRGSFLNSDEFFSVNKDLVKRRGE